MIFLKDYIDYELRKNDILYRFIIVIVIKKIDIFKIINFLHLMLVLVNVYIIIVYILL